MGAGQYSRMTCLRRARAIAFCNVSPCRVWAEARQTATSAVYRNPEGNRFETTELLQPSITLHLVIGFEVGSSIDLYPSAVNGHGGDRRYMIDPVLEEAVMYMFARSFPS